MRTDYFTLIGLPICGAAFAVVVVLGLKNGSISNKSVLYKEESPISFYFTIITFSGVSIFLFYHSFKQGLAFLNR